MKVFFIGMIAGCVYTLGRAPLAIPEVALGQFTAPTAEPGLQEDLERAVATEISRRASLAGAGVPALSAQVLSAQVYSGAPDGAVQEAQLLIWFSLEDRGIEVQGRRGFGLVTGDPTASASARAQAFAILCEELAAQAIPMLLSLPPEGG